jgi:hypothetical protein
MAEVGESPGLIFPHEDINRLRFEGGQDERSVAYELGHFARYLSLQALHIESPQPRIDAFTVANGEVGADIFPNKSRFAELVNGLGYHAPRTVTVEPKGFEAGVDYRSRVESLDEERPQRFCKPVNAARGRGARRVETVDEALAFVSASNEPYLVQTLEQPQRDWRYVLHRDVDHLADDVGAGWHVIFQKVRPTVVGDGSRSIRQLVADDEVMPSDAKQRYTDQHKDALEVVPADSELVELIQSGNITQGAYGQLASDTEKENLDRFMAQFVKDVEGTLDTKLATLCFDLGVKDPNVLSGEYDFGKIRDNIVFYEHQLPFGINVYLHRMPTDLTWGAGDKFLPARIRREYVEAQVYVNFIRSVIRSGKYLRENVQ